MSEATYYHVTETGLAEGVSLGRITVVLAHAYDSAVHLYLDAAERCIAAERREKALQLLLNTADQRNADLGTQIIASDALLREASNSIVRHQAEQPMSHRLSGLLTKTRTAINKHLAKYTSAAEQVQP